MDGASGEERTHTERQPSNLRDAQESVFGRRRGRAQARELLSEMARPGARTGRVPPGGAATGNSPSDLKTLGALLPDTFSYTSAIEASDDRVSSHSSRARSPSDNELTRRVTHLIANNESLITNNESITKGDLSSNECTIYMGAISLFSRIINTLARCSLSTNYNSKERTRRSRARGRARRSLTAPRGVRAPRRRRGQAGAQLARGDARGGRDALGRDVTPRRWRLTALGLNGGGYAHLSFGSLEKNRPHPDMARRHLSRSRGTLR